VLAFSIEEVVNWLSKMYLFAKPMALSSHDAKKKRKLVITSPERQLSSLYNVTTVA